MSELIAKMEKLCTKAGHSFAPQQLVVVLENMTEEVKSQLIYQATFLLETLSLVCDPLVNRST